MMRDMIMLIYQHLLHWKRETVFGLAWKVGKKRKDRGKDPGRSAQASMSMGLIGRSQHSDGYFHIGFDLPNQRLAPSGYKLAMAILVTIKVSGHCL